jgi:hypothetical protein
MDTDILDQLAASIFKVEGSRFRNMLGYIGKLQGRWSWGARREAKERKLL